MTNISPTKIKDVAGAIVFIKEVLGKTKKAQKAQRYKWDNSPNTPCFILDNKHIFLKEDNSWNNCIYYRTQGFGDVLTQKYGIEKGSISYVLHDAIKEMNLPISMETNTPFFPISCWEKEEWAYGFHNIKTDTTLH